MMSKLPDLEDVDHRAREQVAPGDGQQRVLRSNGHSTVTITAQSQHSPSPSHRAQSPSPSHPSRSAATAQPQHSHSRSTVTAPSQHLLDRVRDAGPGVELAQPHPVEDEGFKPLHVPVP